MVREKTFFKIGENVRQILFFLGQFQEILKRDVCGSHGETFKQHEQEIYNT